MKKIRVSAPATIANLGPGFDVLGVAIDKPRDIVELELLTEDHV
ncbi:homoserine kinase, partial [Candidatus Geothermarchaeota archaeon]